MPANRQFYHSKIGRRLTIYILLFSSLITLMLTALQLYRDYRIDVGSIHTRITQMELSDVPGISEALWVVDIASVETKLNGLTKLPDIQRAAVRGTDEQVVASAGEFLVSRTIDQAFLLTHEHRGQKVILGELHIQASLQGVYQRLIDKAVIILITQAAKTFLVSLFILLIVHYTFTRHLANIARQASSHSVDSEPATLSLERRNTRWTEGDELEKVVQALNDMQRSLWKAFGRIKENKENLELAVENRTHELAELNQELSTFCYSVSHDLRAPLRSIYGFSDAIIEDHGDGLDDEVTDYLDRVKNAATRMGDLIDDLLGLSRVSQMELNFTRLDLSQICEGVRDELEANDTGRKVSWTVQADMQVYGDKRLLRIMMENLIGNAWKYSSKTGNARIECGMETLQGRAVYHVKDNGAGFDMKYYDKLFQVFERLHSEHSFEGTGVGLATVSRVIRRHKGHIWAESTPGEGATFYFTLPLSTTPVPD